jgi:hypothetical protein
VKKGDLMVSAWLALSAAVITQVDFDALDFGAKAKAESKPKKPATKCEDKGDAFTPAGAEKVAKCIARRKHGWRGGELISLDELMTWESGWDYTAENGTEDEIANPESAVPIMGDGSTATGIPQCMPTLYPECWTEEFQTNPVMQLRWTLRYIDIRYEVPSVAWHKHQARCPSSYGCFY